MGKTKDTATRVVELSSENKIQQEIIMYFRNNYCLKHHSPRCAIFSVPNDSRDAKEQIRKIATGLMAGVSDLIVLQPNRTVFVEVKIETGRQSDKQKDFQQRVEALGFEYLIVRSLEEFKQKL
jgi:hypothetical protein